MFCTNCGKEIVDNARFCSFCGSPVQNVVVRTPMSAPAPAQPAPMPAAPVQYEPAAPVQSEPAQTLPEPAAPIQPEPAQTLPEPAAPVQPEPAQTFPEPAAPVQPEPAQTFPEPAAETPAQESFVEETPTSESELPEQTASEPQPAEQPPIFEQPEISRPAPKPYTANIAENVLPQPNIIPTSGEGAPQNIVGVIPEAAKNPPIERPERKYTLGHIMICLVAVAIMAITAGIFAGLYFSVV